MKQVYYFGVAQEGLGGDTADVHAHPAELVPLDDGRAEPQLGGANGADVAGRPTTKHDDVELVRHGHPSLKCRMKNAE